MEGSIGKAQKGNQPKNSGKPSTSINESSGFFT